MSLPTNETPAESGVTGGINLDVLFGEALPPLRVDRLEETLEPRSLHQLDTASAGLLGQLMAVTERGLGVTRYVYCELPILWIVDQGGKIWFSIEEIVKSETQEFVSPRLRNATVEKAYQRLGHPALIGAAAGRIGGEILFDINGEPPSWFITNGSGRYGLLPGRQPSHLSNVSGKFAGFGIMLRDFFIPVRRGGL